MSDISAPKQNLGLVAKIKWKAERLLTSHPYSYYYTKKVVERIPWFLRHDGDFYGIPVFLKDDPKALVLDVGANDGISARSIRKLLPKAKIVSFEINPLHQNSLSRIAKKDPNFDYHIKGLGDEKTAGYLYTPIYRGIPIHSAASVLPNGLRESLSTTFPSKIVNQIEVRPSPVEIDKLDTFNLNPKFIKIDAEGFEIPILRGARATIERSRPVILAEIWNLQSKDLSDFLKPLNYRIWYFKGNKDAEKRNQNSDEKNGFLVPHEIAVNSNHFWCKDSQ